MNTNWYLPLAVVLLALGNSANEASAFSGPPAANGVVNNCQHAPSAGITPRRQQRARTTLFSSKKSNDDTDSLLEKARRLRREVSAIESTKMELQQEKDAEERGRRATEREEEKQREKQRMRYSAEVPILKDMGDEVMQRVDFPPRLKGGKSRVLAVRAPLPLGLVLGEDGSAPGLAYVDGVEPGGNGASAGVRRGDLVRAATACRTAMEAPTWQLIAGGVGRPRTKRFVYSADGRPLEEVLDAVGSNRMDVQGRDVWLVLERID